MLYICVPSSATQCCEVLSSCVLDSATQCSEVLHSCVLDSAAQCYEVLNSCVPIKRILRWPVVPVAGCSTLQLLAAAWGQGPLQPSPNTAQHFITL